MRENKIFTAGAEIKYFVTWLQKLSKGRDKQPNEHIKSNTTQFVKKKATERYRKTLKKLA